MQILRDGVPGDVDLIVAKTGFKRRTLYNLKKQLKINLNFSPINKQIRMKSRIFNDEEEDSIANFIWTQKILKGSCFTDEDAVVILTDAFLDKHYADDDFDFTYVVSKGYIYDFKIRHNFVSKLCHLKRRPAQEMQNTIFIDLFIDEMKHIFETVPYVRIVNVDETAIFVSPKQLKIWHSKGVDDVSIPVNFNEKQRITAVCAVAADGFKFPIQFIAKGKTDEVFDTQLGDVFPHLCARSEKGWTDIETFRQFLYHIRSHYEDDDEIHLILDLYKAHNNDEIKEVAKDLGIILHFIPAGFTDKFQPLDAKIFAVIKAYIRHMVRQCLREGKELTKRDACGWMIRAWEKLDPTMVQDSFDYLVVGEKWEGYGYGDCAISHTCRFTRASPKEKKQMLYDEIKNNSFTDDNGVALTDYIVDAFGENETLTVNQIKSYICENAEVDDFSLIDIDINDAIRRLVAIKVLIKDYTVAAPTFKLDFDVGASEKIVHQANI